jgi:DNA-binding SARP family transcriptional activator
MSPRRRSKGPSLQVHLLGGFAVRIDGKPVQGFESQKVRALLAYLACHRAQPLGRTSLAALLWGDRPDPSARRNLRQALHNLRTVISAHTEASEVLVSTSDQVRLHSQLDCVVDSEAFEEAHRLGVRPGGPDLHRLRIAARLYIGEFLPGFFLQSCPEFETWLITMQERLREAAIETFSKLAESHLSRGEFHLGIQFARRLLAIEPMSEGAYRTLMRLYSLSGRAGKALELYERLSSLLQGELGVEPLQETAALYESIVEARIASPERPESTRTAAMPILPLTGRAEAHARLREAWEAVVEKRGRLTLITGEMGVGKTRLARSFVDGVSSQRFSLVLRGQAHSSGPIIGLRPFAAMVDGALSELLPDTQQELISRLSPRARADLVRIAPELPEAVPTLRSRAPSKSSRPSKAVTTLASSLIELFTLLIEELEMEPEATPVVLLLDDLQWCDSATLDLVVDLRVQAAGLPLWILATTTSDSGLELALRRHADAASPSVEPIDRVALERLTLEEVQEIATSLLGAQELGDFGDALHEWSGGLPTFVAEAVNWLRDLGVLEPTEGGLWYLTRAPEELEAPPTDLHELIRRRIELLPASARRAISTGAVIGDVFEAEFLRLAADEDRSVMAICLQRLLERWLIRHSPGRWSRAGREADIELWERGKRQGDFEFVNEMVRTAVLGSINPIRRQALFGIVGDALSEMRSERPESAAERLAHYYSAAGEWAKALPHLTLAAQRAAAAGLPPIAQEYCEQALGAAKRASVGARNEAARKEIGAHRASASRLLDKYKQRRSESSG